MASVKEAVLSANIAFAPRGAWIATGTVAGAIDDSFSTSSKLEIYDTNLAGQGKELRLAGSTNTSDRFCSLAWGSLGLDSGSPPYGLLAGGLADGTVAVWDPADILSSASGGSDGNPLSPTAAPTVAPLAALQNHTAAVKGLDFNSLSPNLLATGASGGEVLIWDLATPGQPRLYPAMKSEARGERRAGITGLAWNTKVQHILATCSGDGTFSVWDLRKQKPTMDAVADTSGRMRNAAAIAWNPAMSLQVCVASGDDRCPTIQLWDLRNQHAPLHELLGHERGILSVAWSLHDPTLLLSTGHDRRTILWEVPEQENRGELPLQPGPGFCVRWAPSHPGLLATAALGNEMGGQEGQVQLHTLAGFVATGNQSVDGSYAAGGQPLKQVPQWMRRSAGAVFGFGGALARVSHNLRQPDGAFLGASVSISQVVTEGELVEASTAFEASLQGGDKGALQQLCETRSVELPGDEGETWAFLRIHFDEDPRRHLLTHLGFSHSLDTGSDAPLADVTSAAAALEALGDLGGTPRTNTLPPPAIAGFNNDDADAFFEDLQPSTPDPTTPGALKAGGSGTSHQGGGPGSQGGSPHRHLHANMSHMGQFDGEGGASESEIQRAIFVANYSGAVDLCLQAGRMADALLIANQGGAELWARAQAAFMARAPRPYMRIIQAVQKSDWVGLIKSRPLDDWRDTMAILCSFASAEEWTGLCDALAKRLAAAGLRHAATLCWICAGNVDNAVKHWLGENQHLSTQDMQALMEKAVVLGLGTHQSSTSPALADFTSSYASILAAQGCMNIAWDYLGLIPGEASTNVAELRDRVFRSGKPGLREDMAPPFPFAAEEVVANPQTLEQQQYASQGAYNQQPQQQQQQYNYTQQQPQQQYGYAQQPHQQQYTQQQQPASQYSNYYQQQPAHSNGNTAYGQQTQQRPNYGGVTQQPGYNRQPAQQAATYSQQGQSGGYGQYTANTAQAPAPQKWEPPQAAKPAPPPASIYPPKPAQAASTPAQQQWGAPQQPQAPQHAQQSWGHQSSAPQHGAGASTWGAPAGPPQNVSIQNVDTSKVPQNMRPVVASLSTLYNTCEAAVQGLPAKKREMDNNSQRLGVLFWHLNNGSLSPGVADALRQICAALDARDYVTVGQLQAGLTTTDWDECATWLTALKRLVKARSALG
ncbi:hypothetical protein WJX73_010529 [Symbiochloris irregularis]|uniref:Protein transport protein SEC31 n=1 Tax=Symbiochloris irregularis TaxID=706552 RepID=A0AAW1P9D9_9CHLO